MSRRSTSTASNRSASILAIVLCTMAAIPLVTKHEGDHASPGARNAFQLLGFKPGKENTIAARTLVAVVTIPLRHA